jgi:hypothetical protein
MSKPFSKKSKQVMVPEPCLPHTRSDEVNLLEYINMFIKIFCLILRGMLNEKILLDKLWLYYSLDLPIRLNHYTIIKDRHSADTLDFIPMRTRQDGAIEAILEKPYHFSREDEIFDELRIKKTVNLRFFVSPEEFYCHTMISKLLSLLFGCTFKILIITDSINEKAVCDDIKKVLPKNLQFLNLKSSDLNLDFDINPDNLDDKLCPLYKSKLSQLQAGLANLKKQDIVVCTDTYFTKHPAISLAGFYMIVSFNSKAKLNAPYHICMNF